MITYLFFLKWLDKIRKLNYSLLFLCIVAGFRVWIYSAAFPFVGNVDEGAHIDMVVKYSQGEMPQNTTKYSLDNAVSISVLGSCEYLMPDSQPVPLPWWKSEGWWIRGYADTAHVNRIASGFNHESLQPPLYYLIAGWWLNGVEFFLPQDIGGHRRSFYKLYWMRFINIPLIIILVWLTFLSAKELFPENKYVIYSATALVALMPQDTFYSVQNDVLSPVCFGFAFYFCIRFLKKQIPTLGDGFYAGFSAGLMSLVKLSSLPFLFVLTLVILVKRIQFFHSTQVRGNAKAFIAFFIFAWAPLLLWFLWNYLNVGSLTASEEKIRQLTWSYKPFTEWFDNKLFTWSGLTDFWSRLMITFWRGEYVFFQRTLGFIVTDVFYWISSLVFLLIAYLKYLKLPHRSIDGLIIGSFVFPVVYLMVLSLMFDYGECGNPSRSAPYFTSGRLISGAIIPFAFSYVLGFEFVFSWIKKKTLTFLLFLLILACITASEVIISLPVFKSQFNLINM